LNSIKLAMNKASTSKKTKIMDPHQKWKKNITINNYSKCNLIIIMVNQQKNLHYKTTHKKKQRKWMRTTISITTRGKIVRTNILVITFLSRYNTTQIVSTWINIIIIKLPKINLIITQPTIINRQIEIPNSSVILTITYINFL
jgi:hypothetical protein